MRVPATALQDISNIRYFIEGTLVKSGKRKGQVRLRLSGEYIDPKKSEKNSWKTDNFSKPNYHERFVELDDLEKLVKELKNE